MDDSIDCPFMDRYSPDEQAEPLDPLPCPVTLAWAELTDSFRPRLTVRLPANACPAPRGFLARRRTPCDGRRPRSGDPHHPGGDGRRMIPVLFLLLTAAVGQRRLG